MGDGGLMVGCSAAAVRDDEWRLHEIKKIEIRKGIRVRLGTRIRDYIEGERDIWLWVCLMGLDLDKWVWVDGYGLMGIDKGFGLIG